MSAAIEQRNQDATCYVGNLDEKITEELLWELMLQSGPVVNVHMPKDKVSGQHQGYGFVEFRGEEDSEYAIKVMNMIKVYGKPIKVNKASQDKRQLDVGANIFIGNLDPDVDEKLLYDTFSAFGGITQTPKIMRDTETGNSKGYGFVSYDSFESSDLAIECMNAQYLCNRPIVVQYAFKKESQGERHGSQAERLLAASQPQRFKPHTIFSGGDNDTTVNVAPTGVNAVMNLGMTGGMSSMSMPMPPFPPGGMHMMPPPPPMMPAGMPPPPMHMHMPPMGFMPPPPPMSGFHMMPPPPPMQPGMPPMPPPPSTDTQGYPAAPQMPPVPPPPPS
mmetsp:Transcript_36044/g.36727  ORF Transcript_36044/g.36727 Transcript_36044/m.36727 type:complete len:332 (-) Transcript_36044:215-1210(-)|eukprot:CAMPEP_0182431244 /NCGR_PEP_ID=MMETSP1167-20130531/47473_1 /TAXON_ID=2988 /ORGANISM="Mallomonas Sp, Strain CCMP3275" /LENGTH=331 /DNA_ID=CAMNT_0024617347 /DNA_START=48 /DNA_END=1043 /DNA_ORIENTATION=+